jgi:Family of unknown function (DUF5723)
MIATLSSTAAASFLIALLSYVSAFSQDRLDPVAMGKARASVASARGLGAISSNPGALDYAATHHTTLPHDFTFALYNLGGTIGSTYLSSSDFQQIFGKSGGWPDQEARARLGELLQDERLFANAANNLFVARYHTDGGGTFGLHYGHRIFARLNFPDDFTRVIARGELLLEQYRFINRGVGGSWFTELGLSYGKTLGSGESGWFPSVGIGATAKLLQGVAQFEVSDNSFIAVDQKTVLGRRSYVIQGGYVFRSASPKGFDPAGAISSFEAALFPSTSGTGLSADLGISGVLYRTSPSVEGGTGRDAVYFGMALSDVGSITWNTGTYQRTEIGINDTLVNAALSNETFQQYQGTLTPVGSYVTNLPSVFRAGVAVNVGAYATDMDGSLVIDLEGELPLRNVPGNTINPRLALGADWGVNDWLSLRAGVSGGGISSFGVGLGAGVRPADWLSIDIGTSEFNSLFTGNRLDLAIRLAAGL